MSQNLNPTPENLQLASELLARQWDTQEITKSTYTHIEDLTAHVARFIKPLLDRDMEKLLILLYRIDVEEQQVKHLLATSNPETLHEELAALIVQRQLKKVEWRLKYKDQ